MIGKKINQLATELAPESTDLTIIGDPTTGVSKKITIAQLGAIFSGAVSFYTNLASFPATGDINVIYCAKDTQKLYLWTGSAYVEVFPSQALLDTYQLRSEKGNANGYASLDSLGKVPISQLPSSIMEYKGTWNAATNTPTLANGTGDTGDVYICNVAGTVNFGAGPITFAVGDYVIYSGTIWQRSSGAVGTVTSVAASITGDSITISGSPVTTSGTLAFAFAGTGAQYIKGDGTLATFPTTIDQAKNLITEVYNSTGATLTKGTVVYINGGQGNLPTVTKALASGDSTSAQTYGIVQADITNNNNGFVVVAGRLADIDTSAFSVGTQLYLSSTTAGAYTSTKQYAPAHLVYVGIIVRSHPTQGIIEVKIQNGYELDELHNVAAQTPTNNDGLFWESATSLWKNKSIATVLGYTPANAATYVPYTGATANLDLGAFDLISRSAYLEGTASYQAGLLIKQRGLYNFVTGAYTQIVADSATDLNIVHNQANTTRRRYALSVAALQDGDTFQYLLPRANGTFALTSDLTGGTVTSVAALTIGTSGTDLSSTVANATTTPVITLNVPTASATNRGALSSTDWTTFNNKQNALTNPVTGTGTTNYLPKFTGTSAIGNSQVYDDGTNVGIGTTSANTLLSLVGNHAGGQSILKIQTSTAYSSSGLSSIGFNDSDGSRKAIIYTNTNGLQLETGTTTPIIFNTNGNERMRVDASGNVGIGTSSPTIPLQVNKAGTVNSIMTQTVLSVADSNGWNLGSDGTNALIGATNSGTDMVFLKRVAGVYSEAMRITSGGAIKISAGSPPTSGDGLEMWYNGTNSVIGSIERSTGTNKQLYFFGSNTIFENGGTERMRIQSDGIIKLSTTSTITSDNNTILSYSPNGYLYIQGGSTGLALAGSGNRNNAIYVNSSSNAIQFHTGDGNEKARITSGGNVGIGLTNPQSQLHINGDLTFTEAGFDTVRKHQILHGHSDGSSANNNLRFLVSDGSGTTAERMRVNGLGNVGIGTSSPSYPLDVLKNVNGESVISLRNPNSGSSAYSAIYLGNDFRANVAGIAAFSSTFTASGLVQPNSLYVSCNAAGGISINAEDSNSVIRFGTANTERMRITSGGTLCVKRTTSPSSAYSMAIQEAIAMYVNANGNNMINFFNASETYVSSIVVNSSTVMYNTVSDYRLKEDLKSFKGLDLVSKINVYDYKWKSDGSRMYGVVAHELQEILPDAVSGLKDALNKDGSIKNQGVDYSKIVPIMVQAIKELKQELDTLKNK